MKLFLLNTAGGEINSEPDAEGSLGVGAAVRGPGLQTPPRPPSAQNLLLGERGPPLRASASGTSYGCFNEVSGSHLGAVLPPWVRVQGLPAMFTFTAEEGSRGGRGQGGCPRSSDTGAPAPADSSVDPSAPGSTALGWETGTEGCRGRDGPCGEGTEGYSEMTSGSRGSCSFVTCFWVDSVLESRSLKLEDYCFGGWGGNPLKCE